MRLEAHPLKNLSICSCGEPCLDSIIHVGAEYIIDMSSVRRGFIYYCGGCGVKQNDIVVVDASQTLNPSAPMMPLPYRLFSDFTEITCTVRSACGCLHVN